MILDYIALAFGYGLALAGFWAIASNMKRTIELEGHSSFAGDEPTAAPPTFKQAA